VPLRIATLGGVVPAGGGVVGGVAEIVTLMRARLWWDGRARLESTSTVIPPMVFLVFVPGSSRVVVLGGAKTVLAGAITSTPSPVAPSYQMSSTSGSQELSGMWNGTMTGVGPGDTIPLSWMSLAPSLPAEQTTTSPRGGPPTGRSTLSNAMSRSSLPSCGPVELPKLQLTATGLSGWPGGCRVAAPAHHSSAAGMST
jgi:hypothetical protein